MSLTWTDLNTDAFNGALPKSARDVSNYSNYTYKICDRCYSWPSLAAHIVESFGIKIASSSFILGGHCPGYDVKLQDAYSMMKLSLAYGLLCGELWECYINEYGEAEFIVVGEAYGDGFAGDLGTVYLSVASIEHSLITEKVLLTGYKPAQTRRIAGPRALWELAAHTFSAGNSVASFTLYHDPRTLCNIMGGAFQETTQAWKGVGHIDWENTNALNDLFGVGIVENEAGKEILVGESPYETISGFAYSTLLPWVCDIDSTTIGYQENSPRIHQISAGFGNSNFISWWNVDQTDLSGSVNGGTSIPDSATENNAKGNWLGVENVYVYGYPLDEIHVERDDNGDATAAVVKISTQKMDIRSLSRGSDFIVVDQGFGPTIVFANYVSDAYNEFFTKGVSMSIHPACLLDGKLRDGKVPVENSTGSDIGYEPLSNLTMFPLGKGDRGYAISSIIIVSSHAYPALALEDTKGKITQGYMEGAEVFAYAMIMDDKPAPMIFRSINSVDNSASGGTTILIGNTCHELDQTTPSQEPSTLYGELELYWDNEVQVATESMGSGDIQISLPFFDVDELCTVSENILNIAGEGQVALPNNSAYKGYREIMFTCGPDAHPRLGQKVIYEGNTYYVNDINYSYQDSSQYVVNVTASAKWVGSFFGGGWGQSINQLKVANVTREGRVVAAGSNNAEFIVHIDGFGNIACINTAGIGTVVTQGDLVKVTIYNVPQGEV